LNSSLNQGSFELSRLEKQTNELTDERQALQQDVDKLSAPGELERRARELGMVPGGTPAFLNPDGSVSGVPAPATGHPSVLGGPGGRLSPSLGSPPSEASPVLSEASPTPSALAPPMPPATTPSGAGAGTASTTASVTPWGLPTGHSGSVSTSTSASTSTSTS